LDSEKRGPAIIKPIGSPLELNPQGIEIAGIPKMSKGGVLVVPTGLIGFPESRAAAISSFKVGGKMS
jgi:hypothetical protein